MDKWINSVRFTDEISDEMFPLKRAEDAESQPQLENQSLQAVTISQHVDNKSDHLRAVKAVAVTASF